MKKIIATLLMMVLMVSLTACGGGESAEKATINTIEAVKTYNKDALSKYLDYNDLVDVNESGSDTAEEEGADYIKNIFKNIDYKITSSKENGDTAVVSAEITNIDMSNVFSLYIQEAMSIAMSQAFSEEAQSEEDMEEQMNQLLVNLIEENKTTTVTNNVDINLTKVDKQWKVEVDENLQNALMGNLMTVSSMFGE